MNNKFIAQFIGAAKNRMAEIAEAAMLFPKSDLFGYGEQVGRYQGLQAALEILDAILRDDEEKEKSSG